VGSRVPLFIPLVSGYLGRFTGVALVSGSRPQWPDEKCHHAGSTAR
jgi:hypothetical protein